MARAGVFLFFISFIFLFPVSARAAETQPGDACPTAGLIRDTGGPEQIPSRLLICNGTVWKTLEERTTDGKGLFQVNSDSGACNSDKQGRLRYTSATDIWEYCSGSTWSPFEQAGLAGPANCPAIGDLCADGTVFAGWHPVFYDHLFIPTMDQERPGSPGTYTMNWKNATGTNDISTDSNNDGQVNHANRGGAIGSFPAFQACENLGFGGHTDWYLPSQVELYYIWSVHDTIEAGGNITNFQDADYWTSTESSIALAWYHSFTSLNNGTQNDNIKTTAYRVRCVRR